MDNYEIRIVKKDERASFVYSVPQARDHAAVRRAKSLAGEGDLVEVWRGLNCIYTTKGLGASVH